MPTRSIVLTTSYPRAPGDHAGAFVAAFCRHLRARGHMIHVIAPADHGQPIPDAAAFRYAPAQLERLFYGAGVPEHLASSPLLAALAAPAMASMLAHTFAACLRLRPHRLIAHWMLPCGLIARLVGASLDIPVRMIGHSGDVHMLARLPAALTRWLTHNARVAVVSAPLAAKLGVTPDLILPMGFDPLDVTPAPERRDWLWMGRLVPIKAPQDALHAFHRHLALLDPAQPAPHLHIAGDGPLRPELARLIDALSLPATLHGFLPHAPLARIMGRCAASLWSSRIMPNGRHEGAPVSLMEAAAAGLVPCIAQLPGADHLLIDPAAQQLPARDLQGWAAQMAALTARPDLPALSTLTAQRASALAWPNLIDQWARFVD